MEPTNLRLNIKDDEVLCETAEDRGRTLAKHSGTHSSRLLEKSKEILSPNYKPFEIFFNYRRNSPYVSQRSQMSERKSRERSINGMQYNGST